MFNTWLITTTVNVTFQFFDTKGVNNGTDKLRLQENTHMLRNYVCCDTISVGKN
jgi:hypothetical protein